MNKTQPLTGISHAMAELNTLTYKDVNTQRFTDWQRFTAQALLDVLGSDAPALTEFRAIAFSPLPGTASEEAEAAWRAGRNSALSLLTSVRFHSYL